MGSTRRRSLAEQLTPRFPPGKAYVPHVPHPPQQAFLLLSQIAEVFYGGAAGGGKALALDTRLPTPAGWTTMGDVAVGDELLDERGQRCRVLWRSGVMTGRPCYEVEFSDGSRIVADAEHRWLTSTVASRQSTARAARRTPAAHPEFSRPQARVRDEVVTTEQLAATVTVRGRTNHAVAVCEPLDLPARDLPVAPWVLGVWLGDGDTRRAYVTVGDEDAAWLLPELADAVGCGELEPRGDAHYVVPGLYPMLRAAGLAGHRAAPPKHIPAAYLRASAAQRLALLQGIVDSDGHVDAHGQVEVCWTSKALTDGLLELLASLGIKATARQSRATIDGRDCGPRWRVKWLTELPCARLPRKAEAQKRGGFRGTHALRYVVAVRPVESVPVQCVAVSSPSHLFLAGDAMIPTHNSDAGLMGSLQFADVPGYSALIIRRTFADLSLPGAIMDRAEEWLGGTGARKRDGGKLWEFPTSDPNRPATLQFGYAQTHADVKRYQGAEFQYVFVDELTHFEERTYRYLFSRLRGPSGPCMVCGHETSQPAGEPRQHDEGHDHCACGHDHTPWSVCDGPAASGVGLCDCSDYRPTGCACVTAVVDRDATDALGKPLFVPAEDGTTLADVPLRMRSGSNPGGVGHEWVRTRFVKGETKEPGAVFVPAKLTDNPSLDRKAYRKSLGLLTAVEKARLEDGDWDVADDGDLFDRSWFSIVDEAPADCRWLRYWDMAATVPSPSKRNDPDWTVGTLLGLSPEGQWFVADVVRFRKTPLEVERTIAQVAAVDGRRVPVRMEQEPGSSGVNTIDHYRRTVLLGYDFDGNRPQLSKEERARPFARAAEAGNVKLVSAPWNRLWLDEVAGFPNLPHDDQVDSASGAMEQLVGGRRARIIA